MLAMAVQEKAALVDRAVSLLPKTGEGGAREAAQFVRLFYANVAPQDLVGRAPENLLAAAQSLWSLGEDRPAGEVRLRILTGPENGLSWRSDYAIVQIVNDDMPFLVDSVTAALSQSDVGVHLVIHPIVRRESPDGVRAESFMHIEIEKHTAPDALALLEAEIRTALADVRRAVADWRTMRAKTLETVEHIKTPGRTAAREEIEESATFLAWAEADNFTFLGQRFYALETDADGKPTLAVQPGSGLGVLANDVLTVFEGAGRGALAPEIAAFLEGPSLLMVSKASRRSTVHRAVPMDVVLVKHFGLDGRVDGMRLIAGLFTSAAYSKSPRDIPLLRRKVARVLDRAGLDPKSHDGKALTHILDTFPRDELFQANDEFLFEAAIGVLHLQDRQRVASFLRRDAFGRFVSALVYLPRERFDTGLRKKIAAILERHAHGVVTGFYTAFDDNVLGRIHYIVKTDPAAPIVIDDAKVEREIAEAARSFADALTEALVARLGPEQGAALAKKYAEAFSPGYRDRYSHVTAVDDLLAAEAAIRSDRMGVDLYRTDDAAPHELRVKLYRAGEPLPLSDVMPLLENLGLRVLSEVPFKLVPAASASGVWMHDFQVSARDETPIEIARVEPLFEEALATIWAGDMESDGLNQLILRAGLRWREVALVRAYVRFLRQARLPFGQEVIESALARYAKSVALMVSLFALRFDPALPRDDAKETALVGDIEKSFETIENLDDDRILRALFAVVQASLRTNYYQRRADGGLKPTIALKLDSTAIAELPLPRPYREIFVYAPSFEAVHLRGGKIARGGLRWSDRRDDFRTEILGLMKAQQVKNTVIVPVGAKGGFVLKRPPAARDAFMAEGVSCYKQMIASLLDITDNLVDGKLTPPADVVRRDGDDPYLVVAADKGTATFSDYANGVAAEYGFWLGDAFASGGSAGYDHKKMAITARGAWESVKRHFRELGVDVQTEEFTCIGIGDMSGDVFGNGMLMSEKTRLVGAFNHMHIFVDPNPDVASSYAERQRMFALPRSTWADYDVTKLSKGGAIFERKAKSLTLSPEIRAAFDISSEKVTPNELLAAMLKARVDLLFFGGIGTYVKSSRETHADVSDKANDAIRINGAEIRAKVVGEGANLGATQLGRIEAAQSGVRLNTDFVDNSAGVDCSDHEVNIKILLTDLLNAGRVKNENRDDLLAAMTDDVARLVLRDNYQQNQALSLTQALGPRQIEAQARLIRALEKSGRLNRAIEYLPSDEEIDERIAEGLGLTRPELCVLLSYAKMHVYDAVLESDVPDAALLAPDLVAYFPKALQAGNGALIEKHRLAREIVATVVTNSMINRVGPSFVDEVGEKTGASAAEIARAYLVVRAASGFRELWGAIEALDNRVTAGVQMDMLLAANGLIQRGVTWFLTRLPQPFDIARTVADFAPGLAEFAQAWPDSVRGEDASAFETRRQKLLEAQVPELLARQVASLPVLEFAPDVIQTSLKTKAPVAWVAKAFFAVADQLKLSWLSAQARSITAEGFWQRKAVDSLVDDILLAQACVTEQVVAAANGAGDPVAAVEQWLAAQQRRIARLNTMIGDLKRLPAADIASLSLAVRELRLLTQS
jgi:glutamate dehydrogenase